MVTKELKTVLKIFFRNREHVDEEGRTETLDFPVGSIPQPVLRSDGPEVSLLFRVFDTLLEDNLQPPSSNLQLHPPTFNRQPPAQSVCWRVWSHRRLE